MSQRFTFDVSLTLHKQELIIIDLPADVIVVLCGFGPSGGVCGWQDFKFRSPRNVFLHTHRDFWQSTVS